MRYYNVRPHNPITVDIWETLQGGSLSHTHKRMYAHPHTRKHTLNRFQAPANALGIIIAKTDE